MDINLLLDRLDKVKQTKPNRFVACCPAHDDKSPSLQISEVGDRILIHCFAGCGANEVLNAVNLDYSAIYPDDHTPNSKAIKISPVDEIYVSVYKSQIRNGKTPTPEDKKRYASIVRKMYGN